MTSQFHPCALGGAPLSVFVGRTDTRLHSMRLIRYQAQFQESMLTLHRSAVEGFTLGMSQQQDEADLIAVEEVYLHGGGEFLLGFVGERLVAMGGFKRLADGVAELRRMRIARDLQGRGYGTLMLRELERRALQSGVRALCLDTARRRPLTLDLYRKHGYQEIGQSFYGAVETVQFSKILDARVHEGAARALHRMAAAQRRLAIRESRKGRHR